MGIVCDNLKVGDCGNKPIVDIIGDHVNNDSLVVVEIARIGIQCVNSEIVVVESTPTPVEIELAIALTIATANKGVTTIGVATKHTHIEHNLIPIVAYELSVRAVYGISGTINTIIVVLGCSSLGYTACADTAVNIAR